ncbi:MAG: glutamate formimidoyltransferase [Acidobacteriia bacterium]|nr:glutamate formimidoyltransferase [Terriglobia bacterium]
MNRLIECVPNFSEGRDLAKVDAIAAAMSGVPGAWILDRSSDRDHNRSVITLAGEPEAVAEAAIRGVGKAGELIDMTKQSGAHPRIGATDVLPFIPLENVTVEECVALARHAAREIWERYRIPTYFYEGAATRPERVNLEDVRKGQFEGLREAALRDPDRSPDVGEPRLHPTAGAVAVGVRKVLIAYNIHLNTSDIAISKAIARSIRYSSGGLRYVKAIGVSLVSRGIAQVSINLTDFEQTPLHRVFEMVKREAERHGCKVVGSEVIGLLPRKALELSAEYYLQLENFSPARILENRLAAVAAASPLASLEVSRDSNLALAHDLGSGATGERLTASRRAAEDAARANLETALAALKEFEHWMQLEALSGPSILADFRAGRQLAATAARDALDTVDANLKAILEVRNAPSD